MTCTRWAHSGGYCYLLLHDGDKRKDEQHISLVDQQLTEDENLGHKGLTPAGREGIDETATLNHTRETKTSILPVWDGRERDCEPGFHPHKQQILQKKAWVRGYMLCTMDVPVHSMIGEMREWVLPPHTYHRAS